MRPANARRGVRSPALLLLPDARSSSDSDAEVGPIMRRICARILEVARVSPVALRRIRIGISAGRPRLLLAASPRLVALEQLEDLERHRPGAGMEMRSMARPLPKISLRERPRTRPPRRSGAVRRLEIARPEQLLRLHAEHPSERLDMGHSPRQAAALGVGPDADVADFACPAAGAPARAAQSPCR